MPSQRSFVARALAIAVSGSLGVTGLLVVSIGAAAATTSSLTPTCDNGVCTLQIGYTGAEQSWTAPAALSLTATVVGGGTTDFASIAGSSSTGVLGVKSGDVLDFVVGGTANSPSPAYPDGGDGGASLYGVEAGGGGGGTYVFVNHVAELVAGGAGGSTPDNAGGAGASTTGSAGQGVALSGSQSTGGSPGNWNGSACLADAGDGAAAGAGATPGTAGGGPNTTDSAGFASGGTGGLNPGSNSAGWHYDGGGGGGGGYCTGGGGGIGPSPTEGGGGSGAGYAAADVTNVKFSTGSSTAGAITMTFTDPVTPSPVTMPDAVAGQSYSAAINTSDSGSPSPSTIQVTSSNWDGLSYSGGTLSGTPVSTGSFPFTVKVTEPSGIVDNWTKTVVVQQAPTFESASSVSATVNSFTSFTVSTSAVPVAAITETGSLPPGMTFADNGNGTATLTGTPSAVGNYSVELKAANGVSPDATQSLSYKINPMVSATTLQAPSSSAFGNPVTLTAHESPVLSGTVAFMDGTTVLAVAQVDGTGDASSGALSNLAVGTHHLTATFTPADTANNLPSTSTTSTLVVTKDETTVVLGGVPAGVVQGDPGPTVTATTSNDGAVQFMVDGRSFGAPVSATGGSPVTSPPLVGLTAGRHVLGATFAPTDALAQASSQAPSETLIVYPRLTAQTTRWTVVGGRTSLLQLHASGGYGGGYRFTLVRPGTTLPHVTLTSAGRLASTLATYRTSPVLFKVIYRVTDATGHTAVASMPVAVELRMPVSWVSWGKPATLSPRIGYVAWVAGLGRSRAAGSHHVAFSFQWYLNGRSVGGATASDYVVPRRAGGQVLTLRVVVSSKGYASISRMYNFKRVPPPPPPPNYPPDSDFNRAALVDSANAVITDMTNLNSYLDQGYRNGVVYYTLEGLYQDYGYLTAAGYPGGTTPRSRYLNELDTLSVTASYAASEDNSGAYCVAIAEYQQMKQDTATLFNQINAKLGTSFTVPNPGDYWQC